MTVRYRIDAAPEAQGGRSITCLLCNHTSYNPTDVDMFWCDFCKKFLRDPGDDDSVYNSREKVKAALDTALEDDGLI